MTNNPLQNDVQIPTIITEVTIRYYKQFNAKINSNPNPLIFRMSSNTNGREMLSFK